MKIWFSEAHKQYIKPDMDVIFNCCRNREEGHRNIGVLQTWQQITSLRQTACTY